MAQQLFSVAGFTKSNTPAARTLLTWRAGNDAETELYRLMERVAGYTIVGKQKELIGPNPPREGHIDGMILLDDGRLWLFDAKSANARSFDEWTQNAGQSKWSNLRDGFVRFDPRLVAGTDYRPVRQQYESYYYQAQGYMQLINSRPEYQSYRIDNMADVSDELKAAAVNGAVPISGDGFYFYVMCKDDSRLYEEYVPYDAEPITDRLERIDEGYRAVILERAKDDEQALIELVRGYREVERKPDGKLHWKCARCPFVKICWEDEALTTI